MSLFVSNRATDKQIALLEKLEYCGKWDLTISEAAEIIDALFEEQRLERREQAQDEVYDWYDNQF